MAPASTPRLKQSSMDSFIHPQTLTATACSSSTAAVSDYERKRDENIRRNRLFLQKLGISTSTTTSTSTPKPKRTPKPPPPPSTTLTTPRRSTRKHALPDDDNHNPTQETEFIDSSIFRYACERSVARKHFPSPPTSPLPPSSPARGYTVVGKSFLDPSLAYIYSIDVRFIKDSRFLVAAGGKGGFISVYGGGDGEEDGGGLESETVPPLVSWKGSRSWISDVKFVRDNPMLLLSSSNDGGVVMWDIKKQPALAVASRAPPIVAECTGLHSGGIFSMDLLNCRIATASKDSTVGLSRLTPAGEVAVERTVSGHHAGVIRGVCFRNEEDTLADCGADGRICVLDTRLWEPCALTIESPHCGGVNNIQWSKTAEFLLLSASRDPTLLLYDIRMPWEPLHKLRGHAESNTRSCSRIYRPSFVDDGRAIATPGQGSRKISLYSVDNGMLISQGVIGYDASLVMFTRDESAQPRLWAACRHIDQLCPLPQLPA